MMNINKTNNKKQLGFTLIELIAIILILAILTLIVLPVANKIVEEARKQSFKQTAIGVVDAAEKDCNVLLQKGHAVSKVYSIDDYKITSGQDLSISGKLPLQGNVSVDNSCGIAIAVNNNKWCASKNYTDDKVTLTDYVDGSCNYSSGGGAGGGDLLVDKIEEISGSELTTGVNLGADEYDIEIAENGTTIGYYNGKYFSGSNPNNYIIVDGQQFRIIGLTDQGIAVVGDIGSFLTYDEYDHASIDPIFKENFNDLGLVKTANYFTSTSNGDWTSLIRYDSATDSYIGNKISYGRSNSDSYALLSFYDYELTIDRQAYSTCLKSTVSTTKEQSILNFNSCAPTSWLGNFGNNLNLNIGFYLYGTGSTIPGFLSSGKFKIDDSAYSCTDCTDKLKLLIRNDSYYISGTGTSSDPFVYKTGYDPGNFSQTDCFILDGSGNEITSFDIDNSACSKNIVIPATINNKPITTIASYAFENKGITSVNFSNATNLKTIDYRAFADNLITGVLTLPANIETISAASFSNNAISGELIIPKSVTTIGYEAFSSNSIETLTFENESNLSTIQEYAFSYNSSLIGTINLPSSINNLIYGAFYYTNISTVNIPNGVTGISSGAFDNTPNLTTINVDQIYGGLSDAPWGNTSATINWLRAQTYNLTYDSASASIDNTCLMSGKYIGNCTVTITSNQSGYKIVSYKVNGLTYTTNTFVMPDSNTSITDIQLAESYVLESAHPYSNGMNQTYTMTVPGATKIKVTFNSSTYLETGWDYIYITDGSGGQVGSSSSYTGSQLANQSFIVNSNTVNIRMTSDGSGIEYGFYADLMKYE